MPALQAQNEKTSAALLKEATQNQNAGDFEKWLKNLQDASAAAQIEGDKKSRAQVFDAFGDYYRELSQNSAAKENYEKALSLWREQGERKSEGQTLLNIGMVWEDEGQAAAARERYLAALKIFRALDDLSNEAQALKQVGSSYLLANQPEKAVAYLVEALSIYRDEKVADKANEALALNLLGVSARQRQLWDDALRHFQDALKLQQELKNRVYIAELTQKIAAIYLMKGDPNNAASGDSSAAAIWHSLGDSGHEMGALIEQAAALSFNGQNDRALPLMRRAMEMLDGPRESYSYLRANEIFYLRQMAYPLMIKLLLGDNQPEEAFLWSQRHKTALLHDSLIYNTKEPTRGATENELQQEKTLRDRLRVARRQLMAVQSQKKLMTPEAVLEKEVNAAETELERFTAALYEKHPRLMQLRAAEGLRLNHVGDFLPDNTALLEFARAGLPWEERFVLFCVTVHAGRASIKAFSIDMPRRADFQVPFKSMLADFRLACADPQKEAEFSGWELYQMLLGKAAPEFSKKRRLLIAPVQELWSLPFGALPDEEGVPLAEKFEIVYTPSATLAQAATAENPLPGVPSSAPSKPTPKRDMALLGASEAQTAALKNLFPDAAPSSALNMASDARFLHINAPLTINDNYSLQSTLARPASDKPLQIGDIFDINAVAHLAVFAPSKVAVPDDENRIDYNTWELIHDAFLNAGISAQIITFKPVPDARATPFLIAFYSELKAGRRVSTAQRNAIRILRANPQTAHPAYWAPFFLFGNWEQE